MLIDFKQLPHLIEFIGLLKFEKFVFCSVHVFYKVIFYYFRCHVNFLLSDKTTLHTRRLTKQHVLPYLCSVSRSHTRSPQATPKILLESYDRIPSQRGHTTPLAKKDLVVYVRGFKTCKLQKLLVDPSLGTTVSVFSASQPACITVPCSWRCACMTPSLAKPLI